jgi:hypothetical protein
MYFIRFKRFSLKYILLIYAVSLLLQGCKKEGTIPTIPFTREDRNWLIYSVGEQFTFKNTLGHSITYTVRTVADSFRTEFGYTLDTPHTYVIEARSEEYIAKLYSDVDSITIAFYKQYMGQTPYNSFNKLKCSILWIDFRSQFPGIDAIENGTPFSSQTINNVVYNNVSSLVPANQEFLSFTKWIDGLYDQKSGLIEITDTSGFKWSRE